MTGFTIEVKPRASADRAGLDRTRKSIEPSPAMVCDRKPAAALSRPHNPKPLGAALQCGRKPALS